MNDQLNPFVQCFNSVIRECEVFRSIARASELQEQAIERLTDLQHDVEGEKQTAIANHDEDYANLLLGCECVINVLIGELRMWLLLKQEKPEEAWNQLVAAQMASVSAVKAHSEFSHLEEHNIRLGVIEDLVFPPQLYLSSGIIVRNQECSICGGEYEDCVHVIGRPYMGKFCYSIVREAELDHVSIVEKPADKRCRVTHFSDDGGNRNKMTWRIEPLA